MQAGGREGEGVALLLIMYHEIQSEICLFYKYNFK